MAAQSREREAASVGHKRFYSGARSNGAVGRALALGALGAWCGKIVDDAASARRSAALATAPKVNKGLDPLAA